MRFERVFSPQLDANKTWYALNEAICGSAPRKFCNQDVFQVFKDEVVYTCIRDLTSKDGDPVSARVFNSCSNYRTNCVYVGSPFGLIVGLLRKRNPDSVFLKSDCFAKIKAVINGIALEGETPPRCQPPQQDPTPSSSSVWTPESHFNRSEFGPSNSTQEYEINTTPLAKNRKRKLPPKFILESPPNFSASSTRVPDSSSTSLSFQEINLRNYQPSYKKRKLRSKALGILEEIDELCGDNNETLSSVLSQCCLLKGHKAERIKDILRNLIVELEKQMGVGKTLEEVIPDEVWQKKIKEMCVPYWQLLLLKLEIPISDDGWQMLLNRTNLGRSGKTSDTPLILSKNSIKAIRSMVCHKVEKIFDIIPIEEEGIHGFHVALGPVVCWQLREMRLHSGQQLEKNIQFNLKLDGRPFAGRSQVLVGITPSKTAYFSNHSCKSFFPLATANCKENRESLKKLIRKLNQEKDEIKREGIKIDGIQYSVCFKVTLDLKALYLLLVKEDDPQFQLGGKGLQVEFCFICKAIRNCNCDLGSNSVCLEHFSKTKANIGCFKGIREDLNFLLEEQLTSINLCALHCELRNTEQLLGSLGLWAHEIGTMEQCNKVLSNYGPETAGNRITVKMKEGQKTAVSKHNIQVSSFSGNTERNILKNIEEIVEATLPHENLKSRYQNPDVAKHVILNKISFCNQRVKYYADMMKKGTFSRDFGTHQEDITLINAEVCLKIKEYHNMWKEKSEELQKNLKDFQAPISSNDITKKKKGKKKTQALSTIDSDALSAYAAQITYEFFLKVFTGWRDLAEVIRKKEFQENEEHLIDIYDVQCKEWGFLLREEFGQLLGTGDYGHMTIEHTSMLFRVFRSLREYSNQSIEATHAMQRQLYSKASSHDRHGYTSSIHQMLLHFYAERLLFLRLSFREALDCLEKAYLSTLWQMMPVVEIELHILEVSREKISL